MQRFPSTYIAQTLQAMTVRLQAWGLRMTDSVTEQDCMATASYCSPPHSQWPCRVVPQVCGLCRPRARSPSPCPVLQGEHPGRLETGIGMLFGGGQSNVGCEQAKAAAVGLHVVRHGLRLSLLMLPCLDNGDAYCVTAAVCSEACAAICHMPAGKLLLLLLALPPPAL